MLPSDSDDGFIITIVLASAIFLCGVVVAAFIFCRQKYRQEIGKDIAIMDIKSNVIEQKNSANDINQKDAKKINNNYIEESISDVEMSIDNNQQTTTKATKDNVVEGRVDNNEMRTVTNGEEQDHVGDV